MRCSSGHVAHQNLEKRSSDLPADNKHTAERSTVHRSAVKRSIANMATVTVNSTAQHRTA